MNLQSQQNGSFPIEWHSLEKAQSISCRSKKYFVTVKIDVWHVQSEHTEKTFIMFKLNMRR
jgi:hypothetical protein